MKVKATPLKWGVTPCRGIMLFAYESADAGVSGVTALVLIMRAGKDRVKMWFLAVAHDVRSDIIDSLSSCQCRCPHKSTKITFK